MVSHFGISELLGSCTRILSMQIGWKTMFTGPMPGSYFSLRNLQDHMGGSIGEPERLLAGMPITIRVENLSPAPIWFEGTFFAMGRDENDPINYR
jgi:hypothetical protein